MSVVKQHLTTEPRFAAWGLVASYIPSFSAGWMAGELLTAAGYTHQIPVEIVGGGHTQTIHPVSGEWYGGMISVPILMFFMFFWFYIYPKWADLEVVE